MKNIKVAYKILCMEIQRNHGQNKFFFVKGVILEGFEPFGMAGTNVNYYSFVIVHYNKNNI